MVVPLNTAVNAASLKSRSPRSFWGMRRFPFRALDNFRRAHAIPARAFKGKGAQARRNRVGDPPKERTRGVNRLSGLDHGRIHWQAGGARAAGPTPQNVQR